MPAMLGDEAIDILDAAAAEVNGRVLSTRPVQITWRPGRSLHVTYEVSVAWEKNHRTVDRFVAATGGTLPEGALFLGRGAAEVAVWRMTADPALPGLAVAADPKAVAGLLSGVGVPDTPLSTRIRTYRPGRRAVVEVVGHAFRVYLKVVPPSQVAGLQESHNTLSQYLPVPQSHGWSRELGLVVLQELKGRTLRNVLRDKRALLPPAAELRRLLDRMPPGGNGHPIVSPLKSVTEHAFLIKSILPELESRIERIEQALVSCRNRFPQVPVHGDFHEEQIVTANGEIVGLLDMDTFGAGARIDDWANMIGHLATWEMSVRGGVRRRVAGYIRDVVAEAEADTGLRDELRRRVAAVILGLATGPFRAQTDTWPAGTRARVALAERWLAAAGEARD